MKKLLALILAALMVLTGVAALAEDFEVSQDYSSIPMEKTGDYDASGDPAAELMFTSVSVTGDSHTTAMSAFADAVKEFSGGSIECRTYADGTLFSSENEWDAISMGQADLAYISFPTLSTQSGLEWCAMVNSGYFWANYEHMTKTLNDSEVGQNTIHAIYLIVAHPIVQIAKVGAHQRPVITIGSFFTQSRTFLNGVSILIEAEQTPALQLREDGSAMASAAQCHIHVCPISPDV